MAWEPDPNNVGDQEYANEQLNTLMKKYRENEENREVFYNEQKKSRIGTSKTSSATKETAELKESKPEATTPYTEGAAAGEGSYAGLFSGPADLAIQRKLEREGKQ
jgi:hypothetical protein